MPCMKEITTASGTFIIHHEEVSRSEAERICESENTILAPITNQADKDAMFKLTSDKDCLANHMYPQFWIGLEVRPSCKNKKKIFSNGVEWRDELHSHLYTDLTTSKYALALAEFTPDLEEEALRIEDSANDFYCDGYVQKFICLREAEKPARARGLVQAEGRNVSERNLSNFSYFLNFLFVTYFIVSAALKHYRKKVTLDA